MQLLLVLIGIGFCFAFNPSEYPNSQQILPRYKVYWNIDQTAQRIQLALYVQTTGWVGFGLGEPTSGSMPGADVLIGAVAFGQGTITDRYSEAFVLPSLDTCQDWVLKAAEESGGFTIIEVERALNTNDAQDRPIVAGMNKILVAFGETDVLSYHSVNRLISEIDFFGSTPIPTPPSDAMFVEYNIKNYSVGNGQTHFGCMSFTLPDDDKYYIFQIDPIIQAETAPHIHHFLVHICSNVSGGSVPRYGEPGNCRDNPDGGISGCNGLLYGWAPGGRSTILPEVTGFPMGAGDGSVKYLVMEIHYNNPDGVGGYRDNTGFRVWYTRQPRKFEADSLSIADPLVLFKYVTVIPPFSMASYETECPSECTQTLPHEITIFTSSPHMHYVGTQIWTTHWRNGKQIGEIGRVEYWSFETQQQQSVSITLQPGDRLNTHCMYDARKKNVTTVFGPASTDEMCIQHFGYYPKIAGRKFNYCGFAGPQTICGDRLINYTNPTIRDPPGGANKTFGRSGSVCQQSLPPPPMRIFSLASHMSYSFALVYVSLLITYLCI